MVGDGRWCGSLASSDAAVRTRCYRWRGSALSDERPVLIARVRAATADGEANAALIRLVAKSLGVPHRDVAVVAGATGRLKRLLISGNGPTLIAALEKIVPPR
ncbi:MAG: DUF167 family protein [Pseudolabrys sp.]